jgi:hypothetical protein
LAGISVSALWSVDSQRSTSRLLVPIAVMATAAWQFYIVSGYGVGHFRVDDGLIAAALVGVSSAAAAGFVVLRTRATVMAGWLAVGTAALLLIMPAAWSVGTTLANGNSGFPAARPPFLSEAAALQRQRWATVAGALAGDPRMIQFLRDNAASEEFLLATVNARLAAPVIVATGRPVIALGGFSGRDPIFEVADFQHLVGAGRVRFALIGDGAPGLRRIFGEGHQKPIVEWIRVNGRPVDPGSWRSTPDGPDSWVVRGAEAIGAQLYDLRQASHGG